MIYYRTYEPSNFTLMLRFPYAQRLNPLRHNLKMGRGK